MSPAGGSAPCRADCACGRHAKPKGSASPSWVGAEITHKAMHTRVIQVRGPARTHLCLFCAEGGVVNTALDWAQLHGTTGLEIADYTPLCRRCHLRYDVASGARDRQSRLAAWEKRRRNSHDSSRPGGA